MAVYVIADLHLATANAEKSMEVFGKRWIDYIEKLRTRWTHLITENDTVIESADMLEEVYKFM